MSFRGNLHVLFYMYLCKIASNTQSTEYSLHLCVFSYMSLMKTKQITVRFDAKQLGATAGRVARRWIFIKF